MKNKNILIYGIIGVIVIIAILLIVNLNVVPKTDSVETSDTELIMFNQALTSDYTTSAVFREAIDTNDTELSIFYEALEKKDPEVCETITLNRKIRSMCFNYLGVATKDTTICDKTTEVYDKTQCYLRIAHENPSVYFCNNEVSQAFPNSNSRMVDYCLFTVSSFLENENVCENIVDNEIRNWCLRDKGIALMDTTICDQCSDVPSKYQCYIGIVDKNPNLSFCNNEMTQAFPDLSVGAIDDCIIRVAYGKRDESICDSLSDESRIDNCKMTAGHYV